MISEMAQRKYQQVLFLCTGNYYRSRFAEILFNVVAERMGLPWRASSRGLALERGIANVGAMAASARQGLDERGLRPTLEWDRLPMAVLPVDLESAELVVALKQAEHEPLLRERHPNWSGKLEYWHVDDADGVLAEIEREVHDLAARLIGGHRPRQERKPEVAAPVREEKKPTATVKVGRETKGRRGKGVTLVWEVPLDEAGLRELAATLKQRCGTGGTVSEGRIEIQGDQRERVTVELERLGYRVKRVGG
jgi:translation initiation factor 1